MWLLEQHPDLFAKAMEYEKDGYSWMEESLGTIKTPERVYSIKKEHYIRINRNKLKSKRHCFHCRLFPTLEKRKLFLRLNRQRLEFLQ